MYLFLIFVFSHNCLSYFCSLKFLSQHLSQPMSSCALNVKIGTLENVSCFVLNIPALSLIDLGLVSHLLVFFSVRLHATYTAEILVNVKEKFYDKKKQQVQFRKLQALEQTMPNIRYGPRTLRRNSPVELMENHKF